MERNHVQNPDPSKPTKAVEEPAAAPPESKKRKLEDGGFKSSNYFKIRAIISDLRPLFLEVINAPDMRNCKAALEIQKQMKIIIELSKQLRNETSCEPSAGASKMEHMPSHQGGENHAPQSQNGTTAEVKVPETKEFAKLLEEKFHGTYVIGGSPVGWNFLVYPGSKPVYYGETKESFRSRQAAM